MALHWNLTELKDSSICWDENDHMRPATEGLIWATIPVRIGRITETNVSEFAARLRLWEAMHGIDSTITDQDIYAHIGLSTNVQNETRAKFLSQTIGSWVDGTKSQFQYSIGKSLTSDENLA